MTNLIAGATCKDIADTLIKNFNASAPFHVEVEGHEDTNVCDLRLEKDDQGRCIMVVCLA